MTYAEIVDLINTNLASGQEITALQHRQVEIALLDFAQAGLAQSGDIKRIKCDLTYYTNNFETNGLGKNLRLGWAQCNGNNGTDDLTGRVGVGYGLGYSTFSGLGGEVSHTLSTTEIPSLQVPYTGSNDDTGDNGPYIITSPSEPNGIKYLTSVGGGLAHNNMQPYIINLYIMKL